MERAHVVQISQSHGGVPKQGVHSAQVTPLGLGGDLQNDRQHHGGPDRALCLYSLERILALQGEGHPIYPGSTGENLTLVGLDWACIAPGARLKIGQQVIVEITQYTTPCPKLVSSFLNEEVQRMSQEHHPGWARLYARVLSPGEVRVGDPVQVIGKESAIPSG